MTNGRKIVCILSCMQGLVAGQAVLAQPVSGGATERTAPAGAMVNAQAQGEGLAEIVVTAQKRAENVQDVPISIAAFSAETLQNANITAVADLPKLTPGFNVSRGQQIASVGLRIRGVGAAGNTATEPSVATFVDGIYVPRPGAIFTSFLDVQGVEVLRGPQGTLFGRNASVGAVSLRTGTPGDFLAGDLRAEYGTGERYKLEGTVDVPLSDGASLRMAGLAQWFGGYWHNRLTGDDFGWQDNQAVRGTLKLEPSTRITWLLRAEYSHVEGDGYPMEDLLPETVPEARRAILQQRLGGVLPDFDPYDRSADYFIDAHLRDEQWAASSDLSWDVGSGFSLRLINGYRKWKNKQRDADVTFMPIRIFSREGLYESSSHSHELQIISPTGELLDGRLDFVAGLYYYSEKFDIGERLSLDENLCNLLGPLGAACRAGPLDDATTLIFDQQTDSYAAYGQATYELLPRLDLTLGGRYTKDEKDATFNQVAPNPAAAIVVRAPENVDLDSSGSKFTYRINLSWHPGDDQMLFASYSTGYKSGGFNSGGGNLVLGQRRVFGPETVKNYELGLKSTWLDRVLQVNATLFRTDISGFQDRAVDGTSFIVRNAGNLRQQGLELDGIIAPLEGLRLNLSLAYLDSEFTSYVGAPNLPGLPGSQDLTGARATYSPKWSGSVGAQYEGTLGGGYGWSIRSDMSFTSKQNIGQVTDDNPQTIEPGYALVSGRLSLFGPGRRWSVSVFGENLTDKRYCSQRQYQTIDNAFGLRGVGETATRCFLGAPRTFGVSASVGF